ncbi:MAG: hypothetical protein GEV07_29115 [Streptosporangiales bacterium]|nr:hypothetical protein [Streptosporangiales bacterium]
MTQATGCAPTEIALADEQDFSEYAYEQGWTDGLPVVAPTPERVERMLAATDRDRYEEVAQLGPRGGAATVERIAVNAVLAGCAPRYLPVLLTAAELLGRPEMNLSAMQATTSPATPLLVVNGPVREAIGLNCGRGCLGPGTRANATIGRAVRLLLINIGGGVPDVIDKSTQGLPAKFSLCLGEHEEGSPWPSLLADLGWPDTASGLTMTSVISLANVRLPDPKPGSLHNEIAMLGDALAMRGSKHVQVGGGNPIVVLSPGTASIFAADGYDKQRLREELYLAATRPGAAYADQPLTSYRRDGDAVLPCATPDDIVVLVAGGPEANQSLVISSFVESPVLTSPINHPPVDCINGEPRLTTADPDQR